MPKSAQTLDPIQTLAGVQPITETTAVATKHYTNSDKVRFDNGIPQKIGGWVRVAFEFSKTIVGTARSIFSDVINGKPYNVIGTNSKLYALIGTRLENITPLVTIGEDVTDSLDNHYGLLGANPLSATNGSNVVTVTDPDTSRLRAGDVVYFSGSTAFAGLTTGDLDGDHIIRSLDSGAGTYTIIVGSNAASDASGGGGTINRGSGLIRVNDTAHGLSSYERVKLSAATNIGGVLSSEISREFEIRPSIDTDWFEVMTTGEATSSVSGAGGASEYFKEIPVGDVDEGNNLGYGAGLYGLGLYGTALQSSLTRSFPRIWFSDRYADTIITTAGNGGGLYQWNGNIDTAPTLITGAPSSINYAFVSDNIIVTLGAANGVNPQENRVFSCDQNNITEWTSSSENQVFDDDIEGAGRLISHCPIEDYNLIFTEHQTYKLRYIGLPFIWEITPIDESIGIIAPLARVSVKGMAFFMGLNNFYMVRGSTVEVIPANSQSESTLIRYVFDDLNWGQKSKIHAWYNKEHNEVWFHYPSADSQECDRVAVVNLLDFTWAPHNIQRTASQSPSVRLKNPYLIDTDVLYLHEFGFNDDGQPMTWELVTNRRFYGKETVNVNAVIPDNVLTGTMTFKNKGYLFPQSADATHDLTENVTPTTERLPITTSARFHEYTFTGSELDQQWKMGQWFEEVQKAATE